MPGIDARIRSLTKKSKLGEAQARGILADILGVMEHHAEQALVRLR